MKPIAAWLLFYFAGVIAWYLLAVTKWTVRLPKVAWRAVNMPRLTDKQMAWAMSALLAGIFAAIGAWEMGVRK